MLILSARGSTSDVGIGHLLTKDSHIVDIYDEIKMMKKDEKPLLGFMVNPFKPEFAIVIFIHYKPRIAGAILDL